MKSTIYLLVACLTFITSCRKDKEAVKGQWRWAATYQGGFIEHLIVPDAHAIVTLSLEADSIYITYLNNSIIHQGKYSIMKGDYVSTIHFDEDISTDKLIIKQDEVIFYPSEDSLTLSDGYVEGSYYNFTKVR